MLHTTRSHNDITPTVHIHMQNTNTGENRRDFVVSDKNGLLISDFGSSTQGERHNSYYANHPQRAAHLVMFKISVIRDSKNPTTSSTAQIQLSTLFFKILKFSGPIVPGMKSFTLQSHFLSGVYYDNDDCHILCARA